MIKYVVPLLLLGVLAFAGCTDLSQADGDPVKIQEEAIRDRPALTATELPPGLGDDLTTTQPAPASMPKR